MNKPQMAWDELEWITNKNITLKSSRKKMVVFMFKVKPYP